MAQHTCQVCGTVYDTAADCCPTCGNPLAMDICPEVPEAPTPPETPEIPEVPEIPEIPETPEKPEKPGKPGKPDIPEKPATPAEPSPRKRRTWLWVLLVVLVLLIAGGVAAWFLLKPAGSSHADEGLAVDSDSVVVPADDEIDCDVDYDDDAVPDSVAVADSAEYVWDDPAAAPADDEQAADEKPAEPVAEKPAPKDNAKHMSGNVTLPDGSVHALTMTVRLDANNDLTGSVTIEGRGTCSITGTYFPGRQRLMVYDAWGGIFDGQWSGSLYMGSYSRNDSRGTFECRVR